MHLGYHVVALAAFGSIVGWFQSRVLREYVPVLPWVAATAIGFVAILCFEIVERHVVIGPHAGPVEPLMISIGGRACRCKTRLAAAAELVFGGDVNPAPSHA